MGLCILKACMREPNVHSGLWTTGVIQWLFFFLLLVLTRSSTCHPLPIFSLSSQLSNWFIAFNSLAHNLNQRSAAKHCLYTSYVHALLLPQESFHLSCFEFFYMDFKNLLKMSASYLHFLLNKTRTFLYVSCLLFPVSGIQCKKEFSWEKNNAEGAPKPSLYTGRRCMRIASLLSIH